LQEIIMLKHASTLSSTAAALIAGALLTTAPATQALERPTAQEAHDIAVEAYIYFYPLVSMDVTRGETNALPGSPPNSLDNKFFHMRTFPPADFKAVVRSNFDTLYSTAWLNLTDGPVIVSAPNTNGRYYVLPMLDMWTDVFAAPGARTTGTAPASFAVVPPGWKGELPQGVLRIEAPTPFVWICGRTQTNGPKDYAAVHEIQDGYQVTPLAKWGQPPPPPQPVPPGAANISVAPVRIVDGMSGPEFFHRAVELMKANPPHVTDWSKVVRLRRIGIEVGQSYDTEHLDPVIRTALIQAVGDAQKIMHEKLPSISRVVNGWQMDTSSIGVYGNDYLKRAIIAQVLLTANQPQDAIYPMIVRDAEGRAPVGEHNYVLHFAKGALPPVGAFWSLTMYDAQGFQVPNPLNRFVLRDSDPLRFNADGSLDFYIQHDNPGGLRAANWLPAPASGVLGLTMRLYSPRPAVLDGSWNPPALQRQP
jgi:hypothetical protein